MMQIIGLVGFSKEIISNISLQDYKFLDANNLFGQLEDFDKGHYNLWNANISSEFEDINIEEYWRIKGEFAHYASRRQLFFSNEEEDILFRRILMMALEFVNKVDKVLFSNLPHQGVDSVIENCAKKKNKPIYFFTPSIFQNYSYLLKNQRDFSELVPNKFKDSTQKLQAFNKDPKENLYYMQEEYFQKKINYFQKIITFFRLYAIEKSYPFRIIFGRLFNFFLHSRYRKIKWKSDISFDPNFLNIYFPLHLQPELTTSNMGDLFYDQNYAIQAIINHCSKININFQIYVKENPKQRQECRMFLSQLQASNNVVMIHKEYPSEKLIESCDAVCTISGTAGWEAIKSGKKCFLLGSTWYESAPGVERDFFNLNLDLKKDAAVDTNEVSAWFIKHQENLHLMQNDHTVITKDSLAKISAQTIENIIAFLK